MSNNDETQRKIGLPKQTELDKAMEDFRKAMEVFMDNPTKENSDALERVREHLIDIECLYHEGRKLLLERSQKLQAL